MKRLFLVCILLVSSSPSLAQSFPIVTQRQLFAKEVNEALREKVNPFEAVFDDSKVVEAMDVCLDLYKGQTWKQVERSQALAIQQLDSKISQKYLIEYYAAISYYGAKYFCPVFKENL